MTVTISTFAGGEEEDGEAAAAEAAPGKSACARSVSNFGWSSSRLSATAQVSRKNLILNVFKTLVESAFAMEIFNCI